MKSDEPFVNQGEEEWMMEASEFQRGGRSFDAAVENGADPIAV